MNLKVGLQHAIYASYSVSLLMVVGAYHVVTLCVELKRDLSAIAKFVVYYLLMKPVFFFIDIKPVFFFIDIKPVRQHINIMKPVFFFIDIKPVRQHINIRKLKRKR